MQLQKHSLPFCAILSFINLGYTVPPTAGIKICEGFGDCIIFSGYTCKNNKCVCDPEEPGLFRCIPPKFYNDRCNSDQECQLGDYNLQCLKTDIRICKCKRGYAWDLERKKCLPVLDNDMYNGKFDPVRDLIIPGLIIMTIGAMIYLGFKLFCNCGKLWRRRHQEIARELEEISTAPHQQAWIASYRVFSPYHHSNRPPSALSPRSFPLHPTPCMGLFLPTQSLHTQSPPSYEEALKHKVILSSYQNSSLPTTEVPRQLPTLSPNTSTSSSIILNPTTPTPSSLKLPSVANQRYFPISQNNNTYGIVPLSNDWPSLQYSGTTGQVWNSHNPSSSAYRVAETTHQVNSDIMEEHTRLSPIEIWAPQRRNSQTQSSSGIYRPGQPQKIYQGQEIIPSNGRNC